MHAEIHASDSLSTAVRVRDVFRLEVVNEMIVSRNAVLSGSLLRVVAPLEGLENNRRGAEPWYQETDAPPPLHHSLPVSKIAHLSTESA
jgi:hypothetical protein